MSVFSIPLVGLKFFRIACVVAAGGLAGPVAASAPGFAAPEMMDGAAVEHFTGGRTRVVWIVDAENRDVFAEGEHLRLMGWDSRGGRRARVLVRGPRSITTPLLLPDGSEVIFSDSRNQKIYRIAWEGGSVEEIGSGVATDVWRDPETGRVWVYAQRHSGFPDSEIFRFALDQPGHQEIVWNSSPVQVVPVGGFQVSRDGRTASGLFPWPNSGVAKLPDVAWRKHRDGCWPSMAPDGSAMTWTFDGPHRNLFLRRPGEAGVVRIPLSDAPGVDGHEVYHPRWSNHVRYFVMTGPYANGEGRIKITGGAGGSGLYAGRFKEDFSGVEDWIRLSDGGGGPFFPDMWIEGGEGVSSRFAGLQEPDGEAGIDLFGFLRRPPRESDEWPVTRRGLVFLWESNRSENVFENVFGRQRSARLRPMGGARWGPQGQMHLVNGGFLPESLFAEEIRTACMESGELAIEAIITSAAVPQTGPARIVSLSGGTARRNFTVGQEGDQLILRLQTTESGANGIQFNLGRIKANEPHHLLVTYKPGKLVCAIDGGIVLETDFERGGFDDWEDYGLYFGKEKGGKRFWEGYLEAVAIYNRFIPPDEAAKKYTAAGKLIGERDAGSGMEVRAELVAREDPPAPGAIAPYRRALAINTYRIVEAGDPGLRGRLAGIAEWCLLDGEVPADYAGLTIGAVRDLLLEPFTAHPQLESERTFGGEELLDEPLFYHVRSGS